MPPISTSFRCRQYLQTKVANCLYYSCKCRLVLKTTLVLTMVENANLPIMTQVGQLLDGQLVPR